MKIIPVTVAVIGAASLTAAITACGPAATPTAGPPHAHAASSAARGPRAVPYNASDVAFTRTVVTMLGQAGQVASLPARHAATGQVLQYAVRARGQAWASQRQMLSWLRRWHQPAPAPWVPGPATPYRMGPGMMPFTGSTGYWAGMSRGWHALTSLRGPAFDTAWTAMMARGYAAQLTLARQELRDGTWPSARRLARTMITWCQAGLARMRSWYRAWGGPNWNHPTWWNQWNGWNYPNPHGGHGSQNGHGRWSGWSEWHRSRRCC